MVDFKRAIDLIMLALYWVTDPKTPGSRRQKLMPLMCGLQQAGLMTNYQRRWLGRNQQFLGALLQRCPSVTVGTERFARRIALQNNRIMDDDRYPLTVILTNGQILRREALITFSPHAHTVILTRRGLAEARQLEKLYQLQINRKMFLAALAACGGHTPRTNTDPQPLEAAS